MMKRVIKQLIGWWLSFCLSFVIVNIICFPYYKEVGWLDTPNGPSLSIRQPHSLLIHSTEGYSQIRIDKNGYLNPDKELADSYVLMLGSSHTQGKEINPNKKYSVMVNDMIAEDDMLHTYNISSDGNYLPYMIKHFKAAMEAFPDANVVTIEIGDTDYSVENLKQAMEQVEYDESNTAISFLDASIKDRVKYSVKSYCPMLSKINKNIGTLRTKKASVSNNEIDKEEYSTAINDALALIRSECDKPICIVYHPSVAIEKDGTISIEYSETWNEFKKACENNNIDYIDSGYDFQKYYDEYKKVPYGFFNTSLGEGHLNTVGHKIIADEIVEYLEEL